MGMTTEGMRAFRAAATLADVVPTVRIRVRDKDRHLFSVSATAMTAEGPLPALPLCAFRSAVGRAHRLQQKGKRLGLLGVDAEEEPAVDIGLPGRDAVLPGQIYRFQALDGRFLFCFMTDLDVGAAKEAMAASDVPTIRPAECVGNGPADREARRVGFHADPVTELTVVHSLCRPGDEGPVALLMGRLLELCVAAEIIAEVARLGRGPLL
jgi:hypothetical protein